MCVAVIAVTGKMLQNRAELFDLLVSTTVRTYLFSISTSELKERSYIKPYSSEVISHTGARFTLIPSERSKSAFLLHPA